MTPDSMTEQTIEKLNSIIKMNARQRTIIYKLLNLQFERALTYTEPTINELELRASGSPISVKASARSIEYRPSIDWDLISDAGAPNVPCDNKPTSIDQKLT